MRCLWLHASLPKTFLAASVDYAVYFINKSPNVNLDLKCPEEVWLKREMDYSNLRVFRCPVYTHILSDKRSKNDPKAHQCIFLYLEEW